MATYRRSGRRRARSSYSHTPQGQGGGAGRVLLGLLAVAAILYFVTASAAGSWLSDNVVNPIMEAFNPDKTEAVVQLTPQPLSAPVNAQAPGLVEPANAAASGGGVSPQEPAPPDAASQAPATGTDFKLEGATFFAVQMGAFKSEGNAQSEADVVRTRGGAGYVFFDGGLYRVLASSYATEAEALAVRDQLKEEEIESGVCKLEIKEVDLRVTAGANVLNAMSGAVSALKKAREDMTNLSIAFDKQEKTMEQAAESVTAAGSGLKAALDKLKAEAGSDNSVINSLESCMQKMMDDLEQLASDAKGPTLDFSSRMKYTQIGIIADTIEFVNAITN